MEVDEHFVLLLPRKYLCTQRLSPTPLKDATRKTEETNENRGPIDEAAWQVPRRGVVSYDFALCPHPRISVVCANTENMLRLSRGLLSSAASAAGAPRPTRRIGSATAAAIRSGTDIRQPVAAPQGSFPPPPSAAHGQGYNMAVPDAPTVDPRRSSEHLSASEDQAIESARLKLLSEPRLGMTRQIEWLNVLVGFEQANKYAIVGSQGSLVGYVVEENSFWRRVVRQFLGTRRLFTAHVLDPHGSPIMTIRYVLLTLSNRALAHLFSVEKKQTQIKAAVLFY